MSVLLNKPSRAAPRQLLASVRHTVVILGILFLVSISAAAQARRPTASSSAETSRLLFYAVLVGIQLLWVRYIHIGMKAKGRSVSEFISSPPMHTTWALSDIAYAAVAFVATHAVIMAANLFPSGIQANNAFLLPHGQAESVAWIVVSLAAGVCEELAFRGYLQRQLAAISGSIFVGVVLQALIFGIAHGYQGWRSTIIASAYGLIYGVIAWWRGNVRATAAAHAATDILAGLRLI